MMLVLCLPATVFIHPVPLNICLHQGCQTYSLLGYWRIPEVGPFDPVEHGHQQRDCLSATEPHTPAASTPARPWDSAAAMVATVAALVPQGWIQPTRNSVGPDWAQDPSWVWHRWLTCILKFTSKITPEPDPLAMQITEKTMARGSVSCPSAPSSGIEKC